jgi:hypothetical protein
MSNLSQVFAWAKATKKVQIKAKAHRHILRLTGFKDGKFL